MLRGLSNTTPTQTYYVLSPYGYSVELKPNNKQATCLSQSAGARRWVYNWGLAEIKVVLDENQKRKAAGLPYLKIPSNYDLEKKLNKIKGSPELPWAYEVSKCAFQSGLQDLQFAMNRFWEGRKPGKKRVGFPRFKGKHHGKHSYRVTGAIHITETHVKLPRIKEPIRLKCKGRLPGGKASMVTLKHRAGHWFISMSSVTELESVPSVKKNLDQSKHKEEECGVDLGSTRLATCSDGQVISNPKCLKRALSRLKRLGRRVSRRIKGGKNRRRAARRLATQHYKVANARRDHIHKVTTQLTRAKSACALEDLNVVGMLKNRKLSRAISDCGWGEFLRQMQYKGAWYGCTIVLADRFFPSSKTCCRCEHIKDDLKLSDRIYHCEHCGLLIDRDLNASLNLLRYLLTLDNTIHSSGEDGTVGYTGTWDQGAWETKILEALNAFGEGSAGGLETSRETSLEELGREQQASQGACVSFL